MKGKKQKGIPENNLVSLAIILGFTFVFLAVGCLAGWLMGVLFGKIMNLAEWGGFFGLVGFFVGAVFLMQKSPVDS